MKTQNVKKRKHIFFMIIKKENVKHIFVLNFYCKF